MTTHFNPEISNYLTACFHTTTQQAINTAAHLYDNHHLHTLPLPEKYIQLALLAEEHRRQEMGLNRPEYVSNAHSAHFLVKHFMDKGHVLTMSELEKYKVALTIYAMKKINDHLIKLTVVEIEIQKLEDEFTLDSLKGQPAAGHYLDRMKYLKAQLGSLQHSYGGQYYSPSGKANEKTVKKINFGYRGTRELLCNIMNDLEEEVGIFKSPTTVDHFVQVATAVDLSAAGVYVFMRCTNPQFIHMIRHFGPFFTSFTNGVIGSSGLFFSKAGTLYNAHNLNSTKCNHIKKRYVMDAIFKRYDVPPGDGVFNPF